MATNNEANESSPVDDFTNRGPLQGLKRLFNDGPSFCNPYRPAEEFDEENGCDTDITSMLNSEEFNSRARELVIDETGPPSGKARQASGYNSSPTAPVTSESFQQQQEKTTDWRNIFTTDKSTQDVTEAITKTSESDVDLEDVQVGEVEEVPIKLPDAEPSSGERTDISVDNFEDEFDAEPSARMTKEEKWVNEYDLTDLRSRSFSIEGWENEAQSPRPVSPPSPAPLNISGPQKEESSPISTGATKWKICKLFFIWFLAFLGALILHPDTVYDMDWVALQAEQFQTELTSQAQKCRSFGKGERNTTCFLEQLSSTLSVEKDHCLSFFQGDRETSCCIEEAGNILRRQRDIVKSRLDSVSKSVQGEHQQCKAFFSGSTDTDCKLEGVHGALKRHQEWARHTTSDLKDRADKKYRDCKGFMDGDKETGCPLESVHSHMLKHREWAKGKITEGFDQASKEYKACENYVKGDANTSCQLENVQGRLEQGKEWAILKLQESQRYLMSQQEECQSFFTGTTDTGCSMEHAQKNLAEHRDWMIMKATEFQDRFVVEKESCQEYFTGKSDTDCSFEQAQKQLLERKEWLAEHINGATIDMNRVVHYFDDKEPVQADKIQYKEKSAHTTEPEVESNTESIDDVAETSEEDIDEGESEPHMEGTMKDAVRAEEHRKVFPDSYFDDLEPIPQEQIVLKSKSKAASDESRADEPPESSQDLQDINNGGAYEAVEGKDIEEREVDDNTLESDLGEEDVVVEEAEEPKEPQEADDREQQTETLDPIQSTHEAESEKEEDSIFEATGMNQVETEMEASGEDEEEVEAGTPKQDEATTKTTEEDQKGTDFETTKHQESLKFVRLKYDEDGQPYLIQVEKRL